jgi:hypothetical protein
VRILAATVLLSLALVAAGTAAASSAPDAHDRALVRQIDALATTFDRLPSQSQSQDLDKVLANCSFAKGKDPSQAFAGAFVLLPALLIETVSQVRPQLVQARDLLASMRPDSPLFARWLAAEKKSITFLLQFDNGGKPIDMCKAAKVMLAKSSTPAQIQAVLGIDPRLIAKVFTGSMASSTDAITRLNPRMRTFFISAGLSRKHALALTS